MTKSIKGWHFLRKNCRLTHGDGRLIRPGTTVTVPGPPVLYAHGLHASRRVMDALQQAAGPIVCRVVVSGEIIEEHSTLNDSTFVGTRRYVEWMLDATWLLHEFACWCAERALRRAKVKNDVLWAAIAAKRAWLADEITDKQLQMAFIAASSFACSTTDSAAYSAEYSAAAYSATYSVANSVAVASASVASSAANSAARSAWTSASKYSAYIAETRVQERELLRMLAEAPEQ